MMTAKTLVATSFLSLGFLIVGLSGGANAQATIEPELSQKKSTVMGQNSTSLQTTPLPHGNFEQKPTPNPDLSLQQPEPLTYEEFVDSLGSTLSQINELQTVDNLSTYDIQVINVNDLIIDRPAEPANNPESREMVRLHTLLSQEDAIVEALTNSNVDVNSVIGVNVLQDGNVVIFYQ